MKYNIMTFGCKVNQYDSDVISSAMKKSGFDFCADAKTSDIVIINSCTVTENGDKKALHAIEKIKRDNPDSDVVLTGCFPQAFPKEAINSSADIVVSSAARSEIPSLIKSFFDGCGKIDLILPHKNTFETAASVAESGKTRTYVKIEDGCDRFCSYCIIPTARGRVRSRTLPDVRKEIDMQAEAGHKEIVLVGINLSCYGTDIGLHLCDAIEAAADNENVLRVRLSSLEPEMLTLPYIGRMSETKKLCPHFHLSLQSGCDETLKRMNRHYITAEYAEIVRNLRAAFPNCAITTDIMVGFAGETDEEFAQSLEFAEEIGFARLHVFTYSVREGTAAAKRTDHVSEAVKNKRYKQMSALAERSQKRFFETQLGSVQKVLVEKRVSPDFASGYTENYTPVRIYGSSAQKHDVVTVRISGIEGEKCLGEEL